MPGLKVHRLGWADTEQDAQHFCTGHSLGQRRVKAGAALLDKRKMEARRVGDGLNVVIGRKVVIISGNGWKLPFQQTRNCLVGMYRRNQGFWYELRYFVQKLVSTVSCMRLVSRPICCAPVALLLGNVRNLSRLTDSRHAPPGRH